MNKSLTAEELESIAREMGYSICPRKEAQTSLMKKLISLSSRAIEKLKNAESWDLAPRGAKIECLDAIKIHLRGLNR